MNPFYNSCLINNVTDSQSESYYNLSVINDSYSTYSKLTNIAVPTKIHVNPNFKGPRTHYLQSAQIIQDVGSVHINPNFNRMKIQVPSFNSNISSAPTLLPNTNKGTGEKKLDSGADKLNFVDGKFTRMSTPLDKSSGLPHKSTYFWVRGSIKSVGSQLESKLGTMEENVAEVSSAKVGSLSKSCKIPSSKTSHKMVGTFGTRQDAYKLNKNTHNKHKVCNQYKIINIKKPGCCNASSSKLCFSMKKNCLALHPKVNVTKEGKQLVPESMQNQFRLSSLNGNSCVNNITNVIKAKYIHQNKMSWNRKKQMPLFEEYSKHKLNKKKKISESLKKNKNDKLINERKLFMKTTTLQKAGLQNWLWPLRPRSKINLTWRNMYYSVEERQKELQRVKQSYPNRKVVIIGGIMYKSTSNTLTRTKGRKGTLQSANSKTTSKSGISRHTVYIRGEKFLLGENGKTLVRQPQKTDTIKKNKPSICRVDIGGVTYIQKSNNVLIKTNTHQARHLVHYAKQKSIALLQNLKRRNNMPCMIYQRFGICRRHNKGTCLYSHDPKNINLCKKLLKGKCQDAYCLLSHNVVQEKMATCHFFLKGTCNKEHCPYLHVKVNKKAAVCKDFLQGFCNLGINCKKRHVHRCPDFEEKGTCSRGQKCPYPHKTNTNKKMKNHKNYKISKFKLRKRVSSMVSRKDSSESKDSSKSSRKNSSSKKNERLKTKKRENDMSEIQRCGKDYVVECIPKRIKLEQLPVYIPLEDSHSCNRN